MERGKIFPGRYHVLGGSLSALDGIGPEELNISTLVKRVGAGGIREVIMATNATVDGQTTAHYLAERLAELDVLLTRLAHGVPVGGELDWLDDGTLATALKAGKSLRAALAALSRRGFAPELLEELAVRHEERDDA